MSNTTNTPKVRELAEGTGISVRQINRYLKAGCPRASPADVLAWKAEHIRDRSAPAETGKVDSGSIAEARLQLILQQTKRESELAEKYALENSVRRGELIENAEIGRDLSIVFGRLRIRLLNIGTEISNLMPAEAKATAKHI
ncbi:MAG: hypothetical protein ABGZ35_20160, partial [Planctomycetaceae bacterium]